MSEVYEPNADLRDRAHVKSMDEYREEYARSIADPEAFWAAKAAEFHWFKKWDTVRSYNYDMDAGPIAIEWFAGGQTNITYNCLDRHLNAKGDQVAIIWEGNEPGEDATLTYKELHEQVCKFANVLKARGVNKGDRVSIYLPMVPELAIAMLACARIGAIHSIVFGGFSADALADRIVDSTCTTVITCNGTHRGDKPILMKPVADQAMADADARMDAKVETCIVVDRADFAVDMQAGRDCWWHELMADADADCDCEVMDAEDPLFILYTSGSTGQPKGVQHTVGGYMVYTGTTHKYVFDYQDGDIYFCAADIGWVTGHSYIVYGPMANGATTVMFEAIPTYPNPDRYWQTIEKWNVNQFYTAPTAIRAIAAAGEEWPAGYEMPSLRLLGTVGEPINPEAWRWYHKNAGKERCPIVDTWWQTETGGILISPLPGAHTNEAGQRPRVPFFGVDPVVLDADERQQRCELGEGGTGVLAIRRLLGRGMMRTMWGDHDRFIEQTYFTAVRRPTTLRRRRLSASTKTATTGSWAASTTWSTCRAIAWARPRSRAPW